VKGASQIQNKSFSDGYKKINSKAMFISLFKRLEMFILFLKLQKTANYAKSTIKLDFEYV